MARSEKRRSKKLEAQRKKRSQKKREITRLQAPGVGGAIKAAREWPVIAARVTDDSHGKGMKTALLARKSPTGRVVAVDFLVDSHCLGVKDVFLFTGSLAEWNSLKERMSQGPPRVDVPPEYVCKLVRGAVEFARSAGLSPHRDYSKGSAILGDLDPDACLTEFTFGKDGKPLFIAGPYDTPARCERIIGTLRRTVGEGNFDFIMPVLGHELAGITFDDDDDEFDSDDF